MLESDILACRFKRSSLQDCLACHLKRLVRDIASERAFGSLKALLADATESE